MDFINTVGLTDRIANIIYGGVFNKETGYRVMQVGGTASSENDYQTLTRRDLMLVGVDKCVGKLLVGVRGIT